MVLDRCGLGPSATLELKAPDTAWMQYMEKDEVDAVIAIMEKSKSRMPHDDGREPFDREDDEQIPQGISPDDKEES